uniref:Uncharacterized protein n=1 Tax=Oryza sativa subsp. japonica TaxID=39947 RepID=Q6YYJ3_ORYSJ|nr:hypothetical protein [Oryza sativa Japonica Group]
MGEVDGEGEGRWVAAPVDGQASDVDGGEPRGEGDGGGWRMAAAMAGEPGARWKGGGDGGGRHTAAVALAGEARARRACRRPPSVPALTAHPQCAAATPPIPGPTAPACPDGGGGGRGRGRSGDAERGGGDSAGQRGGSGELQEGAPANSLRCRRVSVSAVHVRPPPAPAAIHPHAEGAAARRGRGHSRRHLLVPCRLCVTRYHRSVSLACRRPAREKRERGRVTGLPCVRHVG